MYVRLGTRAMLVATKANSAQSLANARSGGAWGRTMAATGPYAGSDGLGTAKSAGHSPKRIAGAEAESRVAVGIVREHEDADRAGVSAEPDLVAVDSQVDERSSPCPSPPSRHAGTG